MRASAADWLNGRIHVSWLIAWLCAGVLVGIAWAAFAASAWSPAALTVISLTLLIVGFARGSRWAIILMLIAGVCLGLARGSAYHAELGGFTAYYGTQVTLSGTVFEDTTTGPQGDQRMRLANVVIGNQRLPGQVWVSTPSALDIKRGDSVTVSGLLSEGFGNLPASMFRARLVTAERPLHGDPAREFRDWFADKVRLAIPEPQASLGIGYLVGQRSTLPETLDNELRLLGLTHVVVASGYNLTILVRFTRRAFARYSKYLALASALTLIAAFVLITGFSPSMSRAALVAVLSLLAWYFGRSTHPLVLLPFAAAITGLLNPAFVWGDIGWYLSFTAFAGIMILAPLLKYYFWGPDAKLSSPMQILIETMSAQLATLPIIVFVFAQYSPLAPLANLLVLPLVPLAMLLTFFAGIAGAALPFIASIVGFPAFLVMGYMTTVTSRLAALPWASGEWSFGVTTFIFFYAALIACCFYLWYKTRCTFRQDNLIL